MSTKSCSRITWLTNNLANKLSYLSLQWSLPPKLNQTCFIYPRASPTMGGSVAVDFDVTRQFSSQCVGLLHVFLLVSWWAEKRILLGQRKLLKKSFIFFIICVQDGPPIRLWTEIGDEATWFMSTLDAISSSHFSKQFWTSAK